MKAYVYFLEWKIIGKKYLGIRKSEHIDLWKTYFTSSKIVKKTKEEHGDPDIIQILNVFEDFNDAVTEEQRILTENNAAKSSEWLNRTNGNLNFFCKGHSKETREKIRNIHLGRKRPIETILKMREARKKQVISEETKLKMKISAQKRANSEKGLEHLRNISSLGIATLQEIGYAPMSDEQKNKLSIIRKNDWANGKYENRKSRSDKGKKRK